MLIAMNNNSNSRNREKTESYRDIRDKCLNLSKIVRISLNESSSTIDYAVKLGHEAHRIGNNVRDIEKY